MPPKKTGSARSDGCSCLDESATRCRRTTTNARTDGNWLCPLHAALARGESPPRMGRRTRARRLVHRKLNMRRRLRGKQKPPRRGQQIAACTHEGTEPCSKRARASVAGKRYCQAHAAELRKSALATRRRVKVPAAPRRRLKRKQPLKRTHSRAACAHDDPEPCNKRGRVTVETVKYCKRHADIVRGATTAAAAPPAAMPAWEVAANAEFEYLMTFPYARRRGAQRLKNARRRRPTALGNGGSS